MIRFLLSLCLLLGAAPAWAATYYVRTDGGTATQCTGLADAAYDGAGSGEACAWRNVGIALGVYHTDGAGFGAQPRIAGGDTVLIAEGSYRMGFGGTSDQTQCSSGFPEKCYVRNIPSGTSGAPTRILGKGHDTGCKRKPELWGAEKLERVLNGENADWIEIKCLEITDRSQCMSNHWSPSFQCASSYPYGNWATSGLYLSDADNVVLQDLDIHGLANNGILSGRLSNVTMTRVRIAANGGAGWNGELPAEGSTSGNTGTLTLNNVEIAWNGCTELYPSPLIGGCFGQNQGGYGDGIGMATGGGAWTMNDVNVHHNTSDGIDLLYLTNTSTVTLNRVKAWSNAGNQIKGAGVGMMTNVYAGGACEYFFGRYLPAMNVGDSCRAFGNTISWKGVQQTGPTLTIRNSTIAGTGDCLILMGGFTGLTSATQVNIENSVFHGLTDWHQHRNGTPNETACLFYNENEGGTKPQNQTYNWRNNVIFGVKNNECPSGQTCTDPLVRNSDPWTYDARPTASSPMVGTASTSWTIPATDINGTTRSSPTARGAFEYVAGVGSPSSTGFATPATPTVGTATRTGANTATVAFTPPGTTTGIVRYGVYCQGPSGGIAGGTGTTSPITVTRTYSGVETNGSYTCRVVSLTANAVSLPSSASNTFTLGP